MFTKLTAYLDSFLGMGIPGYDCAIYHHGKCVYRHMNGYADLENRIPVRGDERYFVYSCSKVITCTAVMQLYEQGAFHLDDPVGGFLPEFGRMTVKTPDGLREAVNPITIRHLLSMSAGLNYEFAGWAEEAQRITHGKCPTRDALRVLARQPLDFEPGERFLYSLCHDVLGALVEAISGMPLRDYVKKHIFEPMGMSRSCYHCEEVPEEEFAQQYRFDHQHRKPIPIGRQNLHCIGPEFDSGGAGVISTVDDFMKFLEGLRTGKLLKQETIDMMVIDQFTPEQLPDWIRYGYGLGVRVPRPGKATDFGWAGAAGAYLAIDREREISVYYAQHILDHPNYREDIIEYVNEALGYPNEDDRLWDPESESNIMLVGHRGLRNLYPENTMVSFRAALELKMDLIEFDVHFSKDCQLVVCHDTTVDRTTNGTGPIRSMTLAELQSLDAGIHKGSQFSGERIPTLEEVLILMSNADYPVLLNVEIKDYDERVVDATINTLRRFGFNRRSVIACFNAQVIDYVQKRHPDMRTQGFPERYMRKYTPADHPITEGMYQRMFGIGIPIQREDIALMEADVAMAKRYGIRPWLFCADDEVSTILAVKAGATNITCNDPTATIRYLTEKGLHRPL